MQERLLPALTMYVCFNPHVMEILSNAMRIMIVRAVLQKEEKFGVLMETKFAQQKMLMLLKNAEVLMYAVLEPSHV